MMDSRWVIVAPTTDAQRIVPMLHRLVIGRACVGVPPDQRLVLDDSTVSRDHLELRLSPDRTVTLTDTSTNGTLVNGVRVARSNPVELRDGDRIELGSVRLTFRAQTPDDADEEALRRTISELEAGRLTTVVEDRLAELTEREREILALIAQGHSNGAIARRLVVSVRTVEAHVRRIMLELRLQETPDENRRVHAVLTYMRAMLDLGAGADTG